LIATEPLEELAGAGARDGAEVLDHLVAAHADTVVTDRQQALVRIERDSNLELGRGTE
jgi:hypothetical protein